MILSGRGRDRELPSALDGLFEAFRASRAASESRRFLAGVGAGVASVAVVGAAHGWRAAAIGLLGTAGILAFRLWLDRDERGRLAIMDGPGGRRVTADALARASLGAIGIARGNAWAVYETPDAAPRIMMNAEYDAFRRAVPALVEVEVSQGTISVGRYSHALLDSSATGRPAVELFHPDGTRAASAWYVDGRETGMTEAMEAHRRVASAAELEAARDIVPSRVVSLESEGTRVDVFVLEDADYVVAVTSYRDGRIDAGLRLGEDTIEFHRGAGLEPAGTPPGAEVLERARALFPRARELTLDMRGAVEEPEAPGPR